MCTLPPRLAGSATGGPASATAPADSGANADMTSAPAGSPWDTGGERAVRAKLEVGGRKTGHEADEKARGPLADGRLGRTGEGEKDRDDNGTGGKAARRRGAARGAGTFRHVRSCETGQISSPLLSFFTAFPVSVISEVVHWNP